MTLQIEHTRQRRIAPETSPPPVGRIIGVLATAISIAAYVFFQRHGLIMGYKDTISHMQIAERIISSPTPGFGQLGGVWLPSMHLLMLPFVWIPGMYYSGFAGSLVSMTSFVFATVFMYKIAYGLSKKHVAGVIAATIFATNPNVLYLQSTPMTEMLFFTSVIVAVYFLQQWIQEERLRFLVGAGAFSMLATLTRYEGWVIVVIFAIIVSLVAHKRQGKEYADGTLFAYGSLAFVGIIGWMSWNLIIFGNPFNFTNGEYAQSSLFQDTLDPSIGSWSVAVATYWHAAVDDVGIFIVIMTGIGIGALAIKHRKADSLPILSTSLLIPFFVFMTESGRSPLQVIDTSGTMYNLRFGLVIIIVAPVAIAYSTTLIRWTRIRYVFSIGLVLVASAALYFPHGLLGAATVQEAQMTLQSNAHQEASAIAVFFEDKRIDGVVLMESFANELVPFYARIPMENIVYEGSNEQWNAALINPSENNVQWIIMRKANTPDRVFEELGDSEQLNDYTLTYHNNTYDVYERKS